MRPTTLFPSQEAHEWPRLAARDAFVMDLSRSGRVVGQGDSGLRRPALRSVDDVDDFHGIQP